MRRFGLCGYLLLVVLAACAPPPAAPPVPPEIRSDAQWFGAAEEALRLRRYDDALAAYQALTVRHPASPLVPEALWKIGTLHILRGEDAAAREALTRLQRDFPDSPRAPAAAVELLALLHRAGRHDEVLALAPQAAQQTRDPERLYRIYAILGDTYAARHDFREAFSFYALARTQAADPAADAAVLQRLRQAADRLAEADIDLLLGQVQDPWAAGYLFFRRGMSRAEEGAYDEAVWLLETFLERYPGHESAPVAQEMVARLADKVAYAAHTIGCLLPLSGPYRLFGERALNGVELAFNEAAARREGPPVQLMVRDTASDPRVAAQAMEELAAARVAAVLGPLVTADAAAEKAQAAGIPILTLSQRESIGGAGPFVFRNFLTTRMQVDALAAYATGVLGLRRLAILYPDESYGRTMRDAFWDAVEAQGGAIVGAEAYDPAATDFADPIRRLSGRYHRVPADLARYDRPLNILGPGLSPAQLQARLRAQEAAAPQRGRRDPRRERVGAEAMVDFEAVFVPDAPQKLSMVVPQLPYHDVNNVLLLGTNLWHSEKLLALAGDYVQGAVFTTGFFAGSPSPTVARFVARFRETFGRDPGFIEAIAYDSARILIHTLQQPGVRLRTGIRNALWDLRGFAGVTGETGFDRSGEAVKRPFLLQVQGDGFVELDPQAPPAWSPLRPRIPEPPP